MSKEIRELTTETSIRLVNEDFSETTIKNLIYVIRGQQMMLDSDLAMLYQVETKRVNEGVKRNQKRFQRHFVFNLQKKNL